MIDEIHTIWRREIKKAMADKGAMAMSIVGALLFIFILGIGLDSFVELKGIESKYSAFLGPGIIALMAMSGAASIGNSMIKEKESFLKELLIAPISRVSIFVGKILGQMTTDFIALIVIVLVFLEFVNALTLSAVLWAFVFIFLIEFVFYGFSLFLGYFFSRAGTFQRFYGMLNMGIVFLSGVFFPVQNLPVAMKFIAYINPLTYGADGLRGQLTGVSRIPVEVSIMVLLIYGIAMSVLGAFVFRRISQS